MAKDSEKTLNIKTVKTTLDQIPVSDPVVFDKNSDLRVKPHVLPAGITHGMLYRDIVTIAWPSFVELVLTQLTSMADQIMVGHISGDAGIVALSAVGLCLQPKIILMTTMQALNVGCTAMVANFRGRFNRENANVAFRMSLLLNLILATIFMLVGIKFAMPLLHLIGGKGISEVTYTEAYKYFYIQMVGFVPLSITFAVTAALRGIGESKIPLIYNTIANIVNVTFNYFLIYGKFGFPELKVTGASIATVMGQMVAFFIAMFVIFNRKRYIYVSLKEKLVINLTILQNIVTIGIPSMIEQLIMRVGMVIYTRTVTSLGDMAYATHQICMNIQSMSFMTGQAFANASTTLAGQSKGKHRYDMIEIYAKHVATLGYIVAIVLGTILITCGKYIISAYNSTEAIIQTGRYLLIMVGLTQPFQSGQFIYTSIMRGAGATKFSAILTFFTIVVVRSGFAVLFITVLGLGLEGAWYALVLDQIVRFTCIRIYYQQGRWKLIELRH